MVDHPRLAPLCPGGFQQRPHLMRELEMRQMVRLHLHIETVFGRLVRHAHDARVVAQNVTALIAEVPTQDHTRRADAGETGQIARHQHGVAACVQNALQGRIRTRRRTVQHHDLRAQTRTGLRQNQPHSRSTAGDHHHLSRHRRKASAKVIVIFGRLRCLGHGGSGAKNIYSVNIRCHQIPKPVNRYLHCKQSGG